MTIAGKVLQSEVDHCSEEGCFSYVETYTSSDLAQMRKLIESSSICYQKMEIQCESAPLKVLLIIQVSNQSLKLMYASYR